MRVSETGGTAFGYTGTTHARDEPTGVEPMGR